MARPAFHQCSALLQEVVSIIRALNYATDTVQVVIDGYLHIHRTELVGFVPDPAKVCDKVIRFASEPLILLYRCYCAV